MFLKPKRVSRNGKAYTYWALVESVRTVKGPRHRIVAELGELSPREKCAWAQLPQILAAKPAPSPGLFDPAPQAGDVPESVQVLPRGVRVERTRDFGDVYLALYLWRVLGLDKLFSTLLPVHREDVPWATVGLILALARFCDPSSELHVAEYWYRRTALCDLLGVPDDAINKDRLYRAHDQILPHKNAIEAHLREKYTTLFDVQFDLLLYDITSTYFEGLAEGNEQAKRGHSRDKRPDCKQVCIALVVTRDGLPLAYEVFDGNKNDSKTVEDIVKAVEARHGRMGRIWVMDRGMVSEKNLKYLRDHQGQYLVGTPKALLRSFERRLLEADWVTVQAGVEVKLCDGTEDQDLYLLCRSEARREKEKAMHDRFIQRITDALTRLAGRLERAKKKPDRLKVERQIGRILERNSRAGGLFKIQVTEVVRDGEPGFAKVTWTQEESWHKWARLSEGCYLLRTNLTGWRPEDLWKSYIQLTDVEAAFRTQKSELRLRPIWHHTKDRVQAHILFSFLAYAMWKTLEQWMKRTGLGRGPRPVIEDLARMKIHDVLLPTADGRELRVRCVTEPDKSQRILMSHLRLEVPRRLGQPKWVEKPPDVVTNSK
ncbi:MAG: IS1634 family transposase [Planctomycetes bacterium]|nr:IS1634 family transposase [Planctomycetota bacterium]